MVSWIPQNGFIGHGGGRAMRGSRRGAWQGAPYPGTLRMVALRRKLPPGANQRARETRNWDNGFRQIASSSSRQLNSVEDLRGFKIRVPVTALLTSLFSGLGALSSSISYSEFYSALQTHIVEGQENPLAQVSTGKLYEVQKYCALSNHCWRGYWIVVNRRALSSLPADLVDIVNTYFDAAAIRERADLQEMDRSLQAELAGKGMTFNKPDPVQFRAALVKASFYTQWQKTYGAEAWARLEQYTGWLT
jgi:TRAP-type transport system periplasmic protein